MSLPGGEPPFLDLLGAAVRAASEIRRFAAGDTIIREGEAGASAFVLLSGRCDVTVHGEVLNRVHPGELFGEIACLEGATRTATVRAIADSDVLELSGDALRSELRRSPALLDHCLRALAHRFRNVSRRETAVRDEQRQLRSVLEHLQPSLDRFQGHPLISVDVNWQPLTLASGDYYDVLELSPARFLCALGDVMGHGALTTPIVGMVRSQLHESVNVDSRPHQLLTHVHRHMRRHGDPNVFMTLSLLILDFESSTAEFGVAGPPSPMLWRSGQCRSLAADCGWTLGYPFEQITFQSERLDIESGDVFVFYTDGLAGSSRGPDPDRDILDHEALARIVCETCAAGTEAIARRIFAAAEDYRRGWPLEDDATAFVVAVR
jgi:serine phosphatase RsbU (regulator of sigma subunit)